MHCERCMLPNPVPLPVHLIGIEGGIPNRAAVSFTARLYQNKSKNQEAVRPSIDPLGTDWCLLSPDFGWQSSIRFLLSVVDVLHFLFYVFRNLLLVCFEYVCLTVTSVSQSIKCRSVHTRVLSHWCFPQVQTCLQSSERVPAARLPYRVKVSSEKRYAWCACGHSQKQVGLKETAGHVPARYLLFTLPGCFCDKVWYEYTSFFFSLSATGPTRPKLQASPLCASPLKRAKRSCCVRARKPKTRHTATARTLRSFSRI